MTKSAGTTSPGADSIKHEGLQESLFEMASGCGDERVEIDIEIKSIAESDSGRKTSKDGGHKEPLLTKIIIDRYEGDFNEKGDFHGHGKAHFTSGHEFEGMFADGIMHGKGRFMWSDGVTYEGEMTNNHITGYGRYEWPDRSYYEGEVVDGLRHGMGVYKNELHNVSYSGQWYCGQRYGRGILHYSEHSWYEGDWINNTRHGWGVRRYNTGNVYEGQWLNDKRHGDGTMRWLTSDESYVGMWENGVQHGRGTHTWYLHRVPGSQYPLRNEYIGEFVNGLRHGPDGKFFYASGAVYIGEWENNKKHGWGKLVFKNGRVFEGQFENDHMSDHPTVNGSNVDPDTIPTTSPRADTIAPEDQVKLQKSPKGLGIQKSGPSFTIDIDQILNEFPENERNSHLQQVKHLMLRNISMMRKVYSFYSALGHDSSPDNTFVMTRFQFWRFLKDCKIHHHKHSLASIDRVLASCTSAEDMHNPMEKILLRDFLSNCVVLSYTIFKTEEGDNKSKQSILSRCLQRLLLDHIQKYACKVGGNFLLEPRHAVIALAYMDRCWHIYQNICKPINDSSADATLLMRKFIFLLKDLKIVSKEGTALQTATVLQILGSDDPAVIDTDGNINLEQEMTFLEFFEALIGCALHFNNAPADAPSEYAVENTVVSVSRPSTAVSEKCGDLINDNSEVQTIANSEYPASEADTKVSSTVQSRLSASKVGAAGTGEFLHALSQLTMQEDGANTNDDASVLTEDNVRKVEDETASQMPDEYETWNSKLHVFFTQFFFPNWQDHQMYGREVEKYKAEEQERLRILHVKKEAERRRSSMKQAVDVLDSATDAGKSTVADNDDLETIDPDADDDAQFSSRSDVPPCSSSVSNSEAKARKGSSRKGSSKSKKRKS